ncbi:hypothetical protein RRG08_032319 [Elysia crispata]|uniref:Uncharacterized protein n=1 Tax=Elysia crispata TaxID=231223 RepID=A0AAE1ARH3_9GAST|nr:hypothetical protein RRG08_032319 [Elysia crispata]
MGKCPALDGKIGKTPASVEHLQRCVAQALYERWTDARQTLDRRWTGACTDACTQGVAPFGVLYVCYIHEVYPSEMELVRKRGSAPRFPFELFREQERSYDSRADSGARWQSLEDLRSAAAALQQAGTPRGTILGRIDRATAKKLLAWGYGELYAMGYGGDVLFCLPGGTVVV